MNREFRTQVINGKFVITEVSDGKWNNITRELAWQRARAQANPVTFVALDGTERDFGDVFDTLAWERAMYTGHIGYQTSMTDGHYAPEDFDRWVSYFRQNPTTRCIDVTPETKDAMTRYLASR